MIFDTNINYGPWPFQALTQKKPGEFINKLKGLGITGGFISAIDAVSNRDVDACNYRLAENFKDSEKQLPVIATTVDLLTTGVDIPPVRNIIFLKTYPHFIPILWKIQNHIFQSW